jgi:hypothetical protein
MQLNPLYCFIFIVLVAMKMTNDYNWQPFSTYAPSLSAAHPDNDLFAIYRYRRDLLANIFFSGKLAVKFLLKYKLYI